MITKVRSTVEWFYLEVKPYWSTTDSKQKLRDGKEGVGRKWHDVTFRLQLSLREPCVKVFRLQYSASGRMAIHLRLISIGFSSTKLVRRQRKGRKAKKLDF